MANSRGRKPFPRTLLTAALAAASATAAPAADFFVNDYFADAHDSDIDGICDASGGAEACTLRAAIEEAAATSADDRIFLGTGVSTLTLAPLPFHNFTQGVLQLIGNGPDRSSIVGNSPSGISMIASNGILGLSGVRVAGFNSNLQSAVAIEDEGMLVIEGALFEGNRSFSHGGSLQATESSLLVHATAFADGDGLAGAVEVNGGGFFCDACIFENGTGRFGGAVYLIDFSGEIEVRIKSSFFVGNRSTEDGGAIYAFLTESASSVLILNSTITANSTLGDGGGVWALGPGVSIESSTIVGNTANSDLSGGERGGGIATSGASVPVANSIVSANRRCSAGTHEDGCSAYVADDCSGTILSNGFNIFRTVLAAQCTVSGGHSTADPLLLPLQYAGGPTPTLPLSAASPARDAGNPAGCQEGLSPLLEDQREAPRPAPGAGLCDLGAFEYGALIFDDDFELWEWKWSEVEPQDATGPIPPP